MRFKTLGVYIVSGTVIMLLCVIFRSYSFELKIWDVGFVFSLGSVSALIAQIKFERKTRSDAIVEDD